MLDNHRKIFGRKPHFSGFAHNNAKMIGNAIFDFGFSIFNLQSTIGNRKSTMLLTWRFDRHELTSIWLTLVFIDY